MRKRNPWKKILANAKNAQQFNKHHQTLGLNRTVKEFSCTVEDIERIFNEQNGLSKYLKLPINVDDVFIPGNPLAPSLDRLDNSLGYTPDNICISTRFENLGFNSAKNEMKEQSIQTIITAIRASS